jgi:hypothetical protein
MNLSDGKPGHPHSTSPGLPTLKIDRQDVSEALHGPGSERVLRLASGGRLSQTAESIHPNVQEGIENRRAEAVRRLAGLLTRLGTTALTPGSLRVVGEAQAPISSRNGEYDRAGPSWAQQWEDLRPAIHAGRLQVAEVRGDVALQDDPDLNSVLPSFLAVAAVAVLSDFRDELISRTEE